MTIRQFSAKEAKDFWLLLDKKPDHPDSCLCDICLFFLQPGKPHFSQRTFFTAWLIHRIKLDHLSQNKKAQRIKYHGEWMWKIDGTAYDKAPFLKRFKEILSDVYELSFDDDLIDPARHDSVSNYVKRSTASKFIYFKDNLFMNRWFKSRPKTLWKKWEENRDNWHFCQLIVNFIRSRPEHQATQRELERHFSNKRKADLERAFEWLWFYPSIRHRKKGKSIIFCWKKLTADEIKAYNQRVMATL